MGQQPWARPPRSIGSEGIGDCVIASQVRQENAGRQWRTTSSRRGGCCRILVTSSHICRSRLSGAAGAALGRQGLDIPPRQAVRQRLAAASPRMLLRRRAAGCLALGFVGPPCAAMSAERAPRRAVAEAPQPRPPRALMIARTSRGGGAQFAPGAAPPNCLRLQANFREATGRVFFGQLFAQRRDHRHSAVGSPTSPSRTP